jgi:hypothetical protein
MDLYANPVANFVKDGKSSVMEISIQSPEFVSSKDQTLVIAGESYPLKEVNFAVVS